MRYLFGFACVIALGLVGCSETTGTGGSGGVGGDGGDSGAGGVGGAGGEIGPSSDCLCNGGDCDAGGSEGVCVGFFCYRTDCSGAEDQSDCTIVSDDEFAVPEPGLCEAGECVPVCEGKEDGSACDAFGEAGLCLRGFCDEELCQDDVECDDGNDCTIDTCLNNGECQENERVADSTPCAGGTCQSGVCVIDDSVLPCTEQGVRNAVAAGGGPYTLDCDAPTTVELTASIEIDKPVELDGSNNLTLDAKGESSVVIVRDAAILRGFTFTGGGAGITNRGVLTLVESTVRDNYEIGVFNSMEADLKVVSSTISGNTCGGIYQSAASLVMSNSTVSQNGAYGIYEEGAGTSLENSTVSGPCAIAVEPESSVTMRNTLVIGGCTIADELTLEMCNNEPGGDVISLDHNLESPGDTCGFGESNDQAGVSADDLKLGDLADNGGPTETHALGEGSAAINQIRAGDCEIDTDQRGEPRPETDGTMCDVGAFERQPDDQ